MLQSLEPRREEKDTILINELDEVAEVIFFINGTYEIGFEINRRQHMVLRYKDCNVIGAYGVTFNKRTLFVYKTYTECKGFFIRKTKWIELIDNHKEISDHLKDAVRKEYEIYIMSKVLAEKKQKIA